MPIYPDTRPIKPEQQSVFDSPMTAAIKTAMRWMGLDDPQSQILALMNPMETGPAGGLVGALQKRMQRVPNPIKAYHGSPHDFDQFSMEHIGKGEGAQAYGHGLYFAENPTVAREYQRSLAGADLLVGGKPYTEAGVSGMQQKALQYLSERGIRPQDMDVRDINDVFRAIGGRQGEWPDFVQAWRGLVDQGVELGKPRGRMYEVNIHATPDQLLDWDKPFQDQPELVQQAIRNLWTQKGGSLEGRTLPPFAAHTGGTKGESIHAAIATTYGGRGDNATAQKAAAEALASQGVKGIRYLDQGSRAVGDGSHNYVIWDDSVIDVLKKLGVAVPVIEALRREAQANNGQIERQKLDAVLQ